MIISKYNPPWIYSDKSPDAEAKMVGDLDGRYIEVNDIVKILQSDIDVLKKTSGFLCYKKPALIGYIEILIQQLLK